MLYIAFMNETIHKCPIHPLDATLFPYKAISHCNPKQRKKVNELSRFNGSYATNLLIPPTAPPKNPSSFSES